MKTIAVVSARWGSSRFPGKPLVPIAGVPLVVRALTSAANLLGRENVIAAIDDQRIADVVASWGFQYRMTGSHLTGTDRVAEALQSVDFSWAINIQGDEATLDPNDLKAFQLKLEAGTSSTLNAITNLLTESEISSNSVPKVVTDESGRLLYISRSAIPGSKEPLPLDRYRKQVGVYGYSPQALSLFSSRAGKSKNESLEDIEILRLLDIGVQVNTIEFVGQSVAVDWPGDVANAEALLRGTV